MLEEVAALRAQKNEDNSKISQIYTYLHNIGEWSQKFAEWSENCISDAQREAKNWQPCRNMEEMQVRAKHRVYPSPKLNLLDTPLENKSDVSIEIKSATYSKNTGVNMDEYMANYTEWVKGGLAHACNEAVNISSLMNARKYKEYHLNPPTYVKNLTETPQKKEFRILTKKKHGLLFAGTNQYNQPNVYLSAGLENLKDSSDIWTLEPVD